MFLDLSPVKTDPILGLMAAHKADNNPQKIDLGVGVYKNEQGLTPVLGCVKIAERYRLDNEQSKSYIGMAGNLGYNELISELIFGEHTVLKQDRLSVLQAPGGTGALRIAAEFIKRSNPKATVWISKPTWANHLDIFKAVGLTIREYDYYDYDSHTLMFDEMLKSLQQVEKDDIVLLHACCHNPSGMDLNTNQWEIIRNLALEKSFVPLIDIAYQGFGEGLDEDALGVRMLADVLDEMIVCSSCSKNFGLYRERIGACSVLCDSKAKAGIVFGVLQNIVRGIYSMPPEHGASIVNTILSSSELRAQWLEELAEMRNRINKYRAAVSTSLVKAGAAKDFSFIQKQSGMFSFLGINPDQVARLQEDYSIYMVSSGRMNVAGINENNIDYFARSVVSVL